MWKIVASPCLNNLLSLVLFFLNNGRAMESHIPTTQSLHKIKIFTAEFTSEGMTELGKVKTEEVSTSFG